MKLITILSIALLISPAGASFNPVRENKDAWTCYDYSINFSEQNPDWGMVTMSSHPFFRGSAHMVNYKIINNSMLIHDGFLNADYRLVNWQYDGYYHFYINETPARNHKWLRDNIEVVGATRSYTD